MIVKVKVQLKGDQEPRDHYALVFDDAMGPADLIPYRNALTMAAKEIVSNPDVGEYLNEEVFWLIQLSEFIGTSLDDVLARANHIIKENKLINQIVCSHE